MIRRCTLSAALLIAAAPLAAQTPDASRLLWDSAAVAWDDGRFDAALVQFDRLLARPDAARWVDSIALTTGEHWRTTSLMPNGSRMVWSADSRWVVVEHGARWLGNGRLVPFVNDSTPRLVVWHLDGDSLVHVADATGWAATFFGAGKLAWLVGEPGRTRIMVRDLASGLDLEWPVGGLGAVDLADAGDGRLVVSSRAIGEPTRNDLLILSQDGRYDTLAVGSGTKQLVGAGGGVMAWRVLPDRYGVRDAQGRTRQGSGFASALSADGSALVVLRREGADYVVALQATAGGDPVVIKRTTQRIGSAAISPDGHTVAFMMMPREDWELFAVNADGSNERRLTVDIQHDILTGFLTNDMLLERKGEPRHARSYLVNVNTAENIRLFHNNQVRAVSMEWVWAPSPDGKRVLVVADREGDSFSPERGVYLTDLTKPLGLADIQARVRTNLADERALAERGRVLFAPVMTQVRAVTQQIEVGRLRRHAERMSTFGSRGIGRPGNEQMINYLADQLRAMGWEPEVQWFEPTPGVRSANVVVTMRGTVNPDAVYVVSSHLDTVNEGPGADDNGAGSTSLLEIARVLHGRPLASTVALVWVTGEEGGAYGSREYVRRAHAAGTRIVADLNNDTFAWTRIGRIESTVRYSNPTFRDIEHGAARLFTDLVTHDARMFQTSDGRSFFDVYGDIVGGYGSYPILASPHYHQSHDVIETISTKVLAEVAKATTATLMLIASEPAPVLGLAAKPGATTTEVTWTPAVERGVTWHVTWGPADAPTRHTMVARTPRALLTDAGAGTVVAVKAALPNGLESWEWARVTVGN